VLDQSSHEAVPVTVIVEPDLVRVLVTGLLDQSAHVDVAGSSEVMVVQSFQSPAALVVVACFVVVAFLVVLAVVVVQSSHSPEALVVVVFLALVVVVLVQSSHSPVALVVAVVVVVFIVVVEVQSSHSPVAEVVTGEAVVVGGRTHPVAVTVLR